MAKLSAEDVMAAQVLVDRGRSVRSMAQELEVDESTLRYRLKRLREGVEDGRRKQREACASYAERIAAWMASQEERRRPAPIKELYEELVVFEGFEGSYKSVVRYVNRRRPRPKLRPHRRVEVKPGTQAQVDWVERKVRLAGEGEVTLYAFVMVLSFSRMWAVVWSRSMDLVSWLRCHNRAFERLRGVAASVRIDNLRTGVSSGAGPWAEVNAGYASYAGQVGFIIDPARVRTPTDKGKVERRAQEVDLLGLEAGCFVDLEDLQRATEARTLARVGELTNPLTGTTIAEAWALERQELAPLPEVLPAPFDTEVVRTVGTDGLVWFEGRQYHVPFAYIRRDVRIRGCGEEVQIFCDGRQLVSYPRHTACRRLIRQDFYEGEATERVEAPTPLGRLGRRIVLERSWQAPLRPIDSYAVLVEAGR
jgi:transposase